MADYHSVYKGPEGETTQWQDIQAKLGNYIAKPKPARFTPFDVEEHEERNAEWLDGKEVEELEELEDDFADDRFLEQYRCADAPPEGDRHRIVHRRQKRMEELRAAATRRPRFGALQEIRRSEFVAEVTNAGEDLWVVVLLYKDSVEKCGLLEQCFRELATKYPSTKFVKIVSTDCIPKYPDSYLPTALLYRNTKCEHNIVGLVPWGSRFVTPEGCALVLNRYGDICAAEDGDMKHTVKDFLTKMVEKDEEESQGSDDD